MTTPTPIPDKTTGFEPLKKPLFRDRWIASIISNVGGWMQDTAGTWLMTALTSSPFLIALMQSAASLPVLLFGLLAGATADIYDRRRLLIFWQAWMLATVAALSVLTYFGIISPWILLALTFALNVGSAMNNPAWQAIVPELVPPDEIPDAVALNSAGYNLARAVGPALGGLAVAAFGHRVSTGAASVFLLNSLSFVGVIIVLYRWRRASLFKSALPAERVFGSMRAGLRYLRHAPALQASLFRALLFTFFVSAAWALLAVVARQNLKEGAVGYGVLNGSMGLGAVAGAFSLPRLRRAWPADKIIALSTGVFVVTLAAMAFLRVEILIILFLLAGGFAWTSTMSTLNVSVQLSAPSWVRARAIGAYQMILQGGMAVGGVVWGLVAERSSITIALASASAGLLITLPLSLKFHVLRDGIQDLSPYKRNRPIPSFAIEPNPTDGPVRVTVRYCIDPKEYDGFTRVIHKMRDVRLRDGAFRWGVFQDVNDPGHMEETFLVESWIEYLRQRERFTASDLQIRDEVWSFHKEEQSPRVSHMIYAKEITE